MVLLAKFVVIGDVQENFDGRTAVNVTQDEDTYIRNEMRVFLNSFYEITSGIANNDYLKIEKAARRSGRYVTENAPTGLPGKVPLRFKSLGVDTQGRFDELADDAKSGKSTKYLLSKVGDILRNCNACHASYTFNVVEP